MTVNSDMTLAELSCNTIPAVGSVEDLMTKLLVTDPNVVLWEWLTENEGGGRTSNVSYLFQIIKLKLLTSLLRT